MAKGKFPREQAIEVSRVILEALKPSCVRIQIAGSLRRGKLSVADIEFLYVPRWTTVKDGLFDVKEVSMADRTLDGMVTLGVLAKRKNVNDSVTWGPENKLGLHVESGIPCDFFACTEPRWWNSLVVRTGGKTNNIQIAAAAKKKGWRFEAYGDGFSELRGPGHFVTQSEQDVYKFVNLPHREPRSRP